MHRFEVWAPNARTLEVKIGEQKIPLEKQPMGWWAADVQQAGPGTDYLFVIDGEEPGVPDPRSAWQPEGVHGASRVVDHGAFRWTDAEWQARPLASAIIYELHVGTFTPEGTFAAVEAHLDYLKDLGVTHIELMPVAAFPGGRGWGYDGVDLFAPHPAYGSPDSLKHLVNACHEKGLAVLLDVVYNHLGPVGNYLSKFGPYFTDSHRTPWGDAVNLEEGGSVEVRRFFIDNALMWLRDYHFDGLRLDAVHAFVDRSAIHFLEQLTEDVDILQARVGRHLVVIAESDLNDPRLVNPKQAGGFGLTAQWSDDFHHALFSAITGERDGYYEDFGEIAKIAKALKEVFVYNGKYSVHRDRVHGRPVVGLSGSCFVGFVQNHDQVGNRAQGERISHEVNLGRTKIAAALVLTAPFIPMLFQGEEFGASTPFLYFTDHEDPELGRLISEGRKREFAAFGWDPDQIPDPQDKKIFETSRLNWAELNRPPHAELLQWYKDLICLRHSLNDLADGNLNAVQVSFDEEAKWLVMDRGRVRVACNLSNEHAGFALCGKSNLVLASDPSVVLMEDKLELGPDAVGIAVLEGPV